MRRPWAPGLLVLLLAAAGARAEPGSALSRLEAEIEAIVDRTVPAVVRVEARKRNVFSQSAREGGVTVVPGITETSVGAGFVAGPGGLVLTSHSVVDGAEDVRVTFSNGLATGAEIVDSSVFFRVAVLRVAEVPEGVVPLELSARRARPGAFAILCGRAHDTGPSVSLSLVCETRREYLGFDRFLVVSATLTPGESGAPFVGSDGRVLGIGSASLSERKTSVRIGTSVGGLFRSGDPSSPSLLACCVPASDLQRVLADVTRHGRIQQAWLGVTLRREEPVVTGVVERSPAEGAGLEPGDRIEAIDGERVEDRTGLVGRLARLRPETVVTFRIVRGDEERDVKVPLLLRPRDDERDLLRQEDGIRIMRVPEGCREAVRVGDLVIAVNGEPVRDASTVRAALVSLANKTPVEIVLLRDGLRITVTPG
jgi:S1-C subfamily serine protease